MMKTKIFRGTSRTLSQLQASIKSEFEQINVNEVRCRKISNCVLTQMQKCIAQEGRQFEQF